MGRLSDGRPAFAAGVAPGDQVEVLEAEEKKSFVQIREQILKESGDSRRSPEELAQRCEVHRECGGCDWIALTADAQREQKLAIVRQALTRTGGVELTSLARELEFEPSESPFAYRSRIRLHVMEGRVGFFQSASHSLVEPARCAVASDELNELLDWVRPIVDGACGDFSVVATMELRHMNSGSFSMHLALKKGKNQAKSAKRLHRMFADREDVLVRVGDEKSDRQSFSPTEGVELQVPPGAFTQVNEAVNSKMVSAVLHVAKDAGAKSFLDLYCGVGNFSLPLLKSGLVGTGVELNAEAIDSARASAEGLQGARFVAAPCEGMAEQLVREGKTFELVLVDPPRTGARDLIAHLPKLTDKALLMISCDPVTLARDLKELTATGFELLWVKAFDMFPQTHHVETMALLRACPAS